MRCYQKRLAVCGRCPQLLRARLAVFNRCNLCQCFVNAKARVPTERCPLGVWPC